MNSLAALTQSNIELPGSEADGRVGLPIPLDAIEDTIDAVLDLIDDALLALMEDRS